jgi:hypothetical protein
MLSREVSKITDFSDICGAIGEKSPTACCINYFGRWSWAVWAMASGVMMLVPNYLKKMRLRLNPLQPIAVFDLLAYFILSNYESNKQFRPSKELVPQKNTVKVDKVPQI